MSSVHDVTSRRQGFFWSKVEQGNDCWEWRGAKSNDGYGKFFVGNGKSMLAHRYSWLLFAGELPALLQIDHTCFNRSCVNPKHLEPVTGSENTRRAHARNRKTHCKRGHSLDLAKTTKAGKRECRECMKIHYKNYRERKRLLVNVK